MYFNVFLQVWHVISVLWFEKWKRYVDFDNDQADDRVDDAVAEAHPGEIDNRVLQGAFPEDLSKNISEGTDYILLPSFDGNTLYTTFGGGPKYIRNTISTGTGWPLVYQVKLWPIRLHFWVCTNDAPNPVGDYVCNAYTTVKTVKNLEYDIPKWLGFGNIYNYRLWVKVLYLCIISMYSWDIIYVLIYTYICHIKITTQCTHKFLNMYIC